MRRFLISLLLLTLVALPFVELWLLLVLGRTIGAGWTIGLVVATGVVGGSLTLREGSRALREFQQEAARGLLPAKAVFDGVAIFVGGLLLTTPGVVTDLVGFFLLLPPTRGLLRRLAALWLEGRLARMKVRMPRGPLENPLWTPPSDKVYDQTFAPEEPAPGGEGKDEP